MTICHCGQGKEEKKMHQKAKILIGIVLLAFSALLTSCASLNSNLLDSARQGDTTGVNALLAKGADVNVKTGGWDWTALMWAAMEGHTETVEALLAKGADVNAKDRNGMTALMWAALKGHTETVETLLAKGADVNVKTKSGFGVFGSGGKLGIKVIRPGETALMWAEKKGYTKIVRLLKQAGAKE